MSGNTFTHLKTATPASFPAGGATDSAETTVNFTTQPNTPSPGITRVITTVTGTADSKLFVRVNVGKP